MIQKLIFLVFITFAAAAAEQKKGPRQRDTNPPLLTPSGCGSLHCHILGQLPPVVGCCVVSEDRDQALSEFVYLLVEECGSNLHSLDTCVAEVTLKKLDNACVCVTPNELSEVLKTKMKNVVMPAMRKEQRHPSEQALPNSPKRTVHQAGEVTRNTKITCTDTRQHGLLCSLWDDDTLTAGNTRCRDGHKCDSHGYDYLWCYTDFSNNWEYCCSGPCDFNGEDYRWCKSIDKWEYCGEYPDGEGLVNIRGQTCIDGFMCGKHDHWFDTYWCEHDSNGNWDYCCQPGTPCADGTCHIDDGASEKKDCSY